MAATFSLSVTHCNPSEFSWTAIGKRDPPKPKILVKKLNWLSQILEVEWLGPTNVHMLNTNSSTLGNKLNFYYPLYVCFAIHKSTSSKTVVKRSNPSIHNTLIAKYAAQSASENPANPAQHHSTQQNNNSHIKSNKNGGNILLWESEHKDDFVFSLFSFLCAIPEWEIELKLSLTKLID